MKLQEYGAIADRNTDSYLKQILDWSKNKVSFQDNLDIKIIPAFIKTTETEITHTLGRAPTYVLEVASFPHGTRGIDFTKASTADRMYLKRQAEGSCFLLIF